jgi:opacity protein-like surface antigen
LDADHPAIGVNFARRNTPKGPAFGLGADFAATDRLTVGLEYMSRNLSGDNPDGSVQSVEIDLDTLSLRVGFSF